MKDEEQKIIHLLKLGENTAYKFIYDNHYALLCSIAYEYLKDVFLAETIVDDVIFHLWQKRETIAITSSLRSYLVRAVRNRCINYMELERERREITFSSMNIQEINHITHSEALEYPLASLLEKELEREIMDAIENLPKDSKRVFMMSRFEEKSYEQIATTLDISVNTVKYHIKNALSRLSHDLSKYLITFLFLVVNR